MNNTESKQNTQFQRKGYSLLMTTVKPAALCSGSCIIAKHMNHMLDMVVLVK